MYENKESAAYISTNFTTQPNTPGRFIVWFRNETTLLVLWQPPYPAGVYSEYKVRSSNRFSFTLNQPIFSPPLTVLSMENVLYAIKSASVG